MPFNRERFDKLMFYREAIASVSLSHRKGCPCIVCRAAGGDEEAFIELVDALEGNGKEEVLASVLPIRKDVADQNGGSTGEPR